MYDFAGKAFDDMTVAELHAYLTQPELTGHVASKFNSKTRKAELILIASAAHRSFQDSGDADKARNEILSAVDVADMPAEPAQGLNQPRDEKAKLEYLSHHGQTEPLSYSQRLENYGGDADRLTPKQVARLLKKSRHLAARNVRLSGRYAATERV